MARLTRFQTVLALGALATCATVAVLLITQQDEHLLQDIDGVTHGFLERPSQSAWSVLFFLTPDCPIANQYAPEIRRICDKYESSGAH